jgi:transcriptional regulator GlxA family with amidase domain
LLSTESSNGKEFPMYSALAFQDLPAPTRTESQSDSRNVAELVVGLLRASLETLPKDRDAAKQYIVKACSFLETGPMAPAQTAANDRLAQGGLAPWQVKRVSEYIDANLDKPVTIRDLSAVVRRGPSQFQRAFKSRFGVSPHAYLVKRRVQRAQEMMLASDEPLCAIALASGFYDQAHFTSRFHREVGMTPAAWRRHFAPPAQEETMS